MLIDIPNYEGLYKISPSGEIFSSYRKRVLNGWVAKVGYHTVSLWKGGKQRKYTTHSLLAWAFIPNPGKLSEVNHKDGDKLNNDLENLEWVTGSENIRHAFTSGLTSKSACIDYEKIPALVQEVIAGAPLRDICQREGLLETSALRKLLLREATRTGFKDQFVNGTQTARKGLVQEQSHRVTQTTLEGVHIQAFNSINEAARAMVKNPAGIWKAITKQKPYLGFRWERLHA